MITAENILTSLRTLDSSFSSQEKSFDSKKDKKFEYNPLSYGCLHNTITGEKHLIIFRDNPRPSDYHNNYGFVRVKSQGHFDGMNNEEWRTLLKSIYPLVRWIGDFNWDGEDIPAYTLTRSINHEEAECLGVEIENSKTSETKKLDILDVIANMIKL